MPDPNKTGAEFDKAAESIDNNDNTQDLSGSSETSTKSDEVVESTPTSTNTVPESTSTSTNPVSEPEPTTPSYSTESSSSQSYDYQEEVEVVYEEPVQQENTNINTTTSNEAAVDAYVENVAQQQEESEDPYQYTLQ